MGIELDFVMDVDGILSWHLSSVSNLQVELYEIVEF